MSDMDHDGVGEALRRLKEADATMQTADAVEARLRREVRAVRGRSRSWSPWTLAALAAALIIGLWLPARWLLTSPGTSGPSSTPPVESSAAGEFFPLFYASVPASSTHIVRMEVPRASLARFGLMSADGVGPATGTVLADVLVGDDGLARAVRFVRPLSQE